MSPRAWRERIRDILDAAAEIKTFTQGKHSTRFGMMPKLYGPLSWTSSLSAKPRAISLKRSRERTRRCHGI
jgi:hypothetical protein